jgi:outer membrane protein assembly factor BamB
VRSLLLVCLLTLPVAAQKRDASDWPQWRGPSRAGTSAERGLLREWPKEGPKLLWQVNDIGDGYSTPSVVGDRIYLMSNRGMDNEFVAAHSIKDGKLIWATRVGNVGNPDQNPPYPKARSTPSIEGNLLFALGSDGDLVCMDARSGKIRWQKNVRKEFGGKPGDWAYAESPLVDGDLVVVTPGGPEATLVALNKKTGALVWKSAVPGGDRAGYASAIVVDGGGRRQYVQLLEKGLVGVDAKTGQFLWRYAEVAKGPAQYFTPVANRDLVYTGALGIGGGLVRLKANGDGVVAEQVYFLRGLPNGIGGAVLVGDTLYGTEVGQSLVAAEFSTGKVKWKAENFGWGSVAYVDGLLIAHLVEGDLVLVDGTSDTYKQLGRFKPPSPPKYKQVGQFPEKAFTYPVIAAGRLYIRDLETMWAFDIRKR